MKPTKEQKAAKQKETIEWYVTKFSMKMYGSVPSTGAWWIEGIGNISKTTKKSIWKKIQKFLDKDSRDRQAEHGDLPCWAKN